MHSKFNVDEFVSLKEKLNQLYKSELKHLDDRTKKEICCILAIYLALKYKYYTTRSNVFSLSSKLVRNFLPCDFAVDINRLLKKVCMKLKERGYCKEIISRKQGHRYIFDKLSAQPLLDIKKFLEVLEEPSKIYKFCCKEIVLKIIFNST